MSMLKQLIETASAGSTSAGGDIAGFRAPLGAKKISKGKRAKDKKAKKSTLPTFAMYFKEGKEQDFDTSEVISKLKSAAQTSEERGDDTVGFGLEDESGSTVKVWVPEEQADDFESALQTALDAMEGDDEDEYSSDMEIGEILWNLRKDFDIVNVEWAEIPEDQEEAPVLGAGAGGAAQPAGMGGPEGELGGAEDELGGAEGAETGEEGLGSGEEDLDAEGEMTADEGGMGGEEDAASALQQVIQAMKADAEARKAEAEAKTAQAEAESAKYQSQMAANKVNQEEKILDMEAHNDKKKQEKDETKRLAQLAQYQHEINGEEGDTGEEDLGGEEGFGGDVNIDKEVNITPPEEQEELTSISHGPHGGGTHISKSELGDWILAALRRR